jgi:hypothetical protein
MTEDKYDDDDEGHEQPRYCAFCTQRQLDGNEDLHNMVIMQKKLLDYIIRQNTVLIETNARLSSISTEVPSTKSQK